MPYIHDMFIYYKLINTAHCSALVGSVERQAGHDGCWHSSLLGPHAFTGITSQASLSGCCLPHSGNMPGAHRLYVMHADFVFHLLHWSEACHWLVLGQPAVCHQTLASAGQLWPTLQAELARLQ